MLFDSLTERRCRPAAATPKGTGGLKMKSKVLTSALLIIALLFAATAWSGRVDADASSLSQIVFYVA